MTAVPTIGKIRYRPHLVTSRPQMIEVVSRPAISGSSRSPEMVGLAPLTICSYCGRYAIAPNIANPTTKPTALDAENTRLRNRCNGTTGSAARLSAQTNSPVQTTAIAPRVKIGADDQAKVVPPSEVISTRLVAAPASSAVPR